MTKYKRGIEFIALNDGPGDDEAEFVDHVAGMTTVILMSEIFGKDTNEIANDVVRFRKKQPCQCRACEKCCPGEDL